MEHEEIVCRCEEVTREDIAKAIREGARSIDDIKKKTRVGMGYCQGRTCKKIISQMLAAYYGNPVGDYLPGSVRMPVGTITLGELAELEDGTEE